MSLGALNCFEAPHVGCYCFKTLLIGGNSFRLEPSASRRNRSVTLP